MPHAFYGIRFFVWFGEWVVRNEVSCQVEVADTESEETDKGEEEADTKAKTNVK